MRLLEVGAKQAKLLLVIGRILLVYCGIVSLLFFVQVFYAHMILLIQVKGDYWSTMEARYFSTQTQPIADYITQLVLAPIVSGVAGVICFRYQRDVRSWKSIILCGIFYILYMLINMAYLEFIAHVPSYEPHSFISPTLIVLSGCIFRLIERQKKRV